MTDFLLPDFTFKLFFKFFFKKGLCHLVYRFFFVVCTHITTTQMLHDQRIWLLISLKISGEATKEELEELEVLLKQNPELAATVDDLQRLWKKSHKVVTEETEDAFARHAQRLNKIMSPVVIEPERKIKVKAVLYKFWWAAAAACVFIIWFFARSSEGNPSKAIDNTVSTKAGYKASINLPDGSKVWLNGDSKITYAGDLKGKTREIFLSGEAFFDIAKDKTRPFIIHTRTINLKVLGTAFNVRSYENDKETETALVHGSIEVTLLSNPDKKIILKPGEKLLVKNSSPFDSLSKDKKAEVSDEDAPIAVLAKMRYYGNDSSIVETSWTKNRLVFYDERLDKIALNLERWFNVSVTIKDEQLKKGKYTATIEEGDKLNEVLEALKATEGFHYSINNKAVIISR
jgi:ferric-dicitrate binding protein FerR (iron transport regulator)